MAAAGAAARYDTTMLPAHLDGLTGRGREGESQVGLPAAAAWDGILSLDAAGRKTRYFRHLPSSLPSWLLFVGRFSRRRR